MSTFHRLRVLFLLAVLLVVAWGTWLTQLRSTDWDRPLVVALYPVNGDGSERSRAYIDSLSVGNFRDIEDFFREEATEYRLPLRQPVELVMGPVLAEHPPEPPRNRNPLGVMWWSLTIRYWVWNVAREHGPPADIQIFVLYYDPDTHPHLAHSLGLQKGLLGVVHAFSSRRQAADNNLVIAHELLHTLGATDKYDLQTNQPLFPTGYAEPGRVPLLPQEFAEIMAGRIPVSETYVVQADGLWSAVVGEYTAREIRWLD